MASKKDYSRGNELGMEQDMQNLEEDDPVLMAFRDFDKNDDGKITMHEFRYILTHIGNDKFDKDEVDQFFRDCKLKDEDELDYENFTSFWRSNMKNLEN